MKNTILYLGILLLLLNVIASLLLTMYPPFNMIVNCVVIIATTVMIWLLLFTKQNTPFSIVLALIFGVIGVLQLVCGCFMPNQLHDNWILLTIITLWIIEIILFVISNYISKNIKNK